MAGPVGVRRQPARLRRAGAAAPDAYEREPADQEVRFTGPGGQAGGFVRGVQAAGSEPSVITAGDVRPGMAR